MQCAGRCCASSDRLGARHGRSWCVVQPQVRTQGTRSARRPRAGPRLARRAGQASSSKSSGFTIRCSSAVTGRLVRHYGIRTSRLVPRLVPADRKWAAGHGWHGWGSGRRADPRRIRDGPAARALRPRSAWGVPDGTQSDPANRTRPPGPTTRLSGGVPRTDRKGCFQLPPTQSQKREDYC
mgnify:CR=1 FL=1